MIINAAETEFTTNIKKTLEVLIDGVKWKNGFVQILGEQKIDLLIA